MNRYDFSIRAPALPSVLLPDDTEFRAVSKAGARMSETVNPEVDPWRSALID
jgi:hypothetical protein